MKIESGLQALSQLAKEQDGFSLAGSEEAGNGLSIGQGDTVSISSAAKALAAQKGGESEGSGGGTPEEQLIKRLKERIEQLKREIEEVKQSNLPEEDKQRQIQNKKAEIAQINEQINDLLGNGDGPVAGGTRAKGFGNSLT